MASSPGADPPGRARAAQPIRPPSLGDGGILLRPHRDDDLAGLLTQAGDDLTRRWSQVRVPYLPSDAREYLAGRPEAWAHGHDLALAIESQGRYAGTVALAPDGAGAAWLDVALVPQARGRGTATAAVRLLLAWAFAALDLEAVHWTVPVGHWPARRVAWAVGFRIEGTLRSWLPAPVGGPAVDPAVGPAVGLAARSADDPAPGPAPHPADDPADDPAVRARAGRSDAWVATLLRGEPLTPAHPWLTPAVLLGQVRLRPHVPQDAEQIVEACSDPETRHWLSSLPSPYLIEDARRHLREIAEQHACGRSMYWAVADRDSGRLIGEIGVFGLGGRPVRGGEIGYWAHPQARGRGATTEALRLVVRHALLPLDVGGLGLARVVVRAAAGNTPSRRVALAAGLRQSGVDRSAELLRDGSVDDLVRYDLLAHELGPTVAPPEQPEPAR